MYDARGTGAPVWRVDVRSDTVTRPDAPMRAAMAAAEVGDDVYGEDPTVNWLERVMAERLGMAAALLTPSATMSNLCAMLAHCGRGDEVLTGETYHVWKWEARGATVLGGLAMTPLAVEPDRGIAAQTIAHAISPDDPHKPVTRALVLENTNDGFAVPMARTLGAVDAARAAGLAVHLDGARFFDAATALGCGEAELAAPFDTVQLCMSKGLGAPMGSVLAGSDPAIGAARRWRKMLGGGLRQSGIAAAAALHALENDLNRLKESHERAAILARHIEQGGLGHATAATNMVWVTLDEDVRAGLASRAVERGIAIRFGPTTRLVLHRDVDDEGFAELCGLFDAA